MSCNGTIEYENLDVTCHFKHTGSTLGFYSATLVSKPSALTGPNNGTVGTLLYTAAEAAIIVNMRIRINELETKLQSLGLVS